MITRQQYINKECTHQEYYAQFVSDRVKRDILQVIGAKALLASTDPHLNDIPMALWSNLQSSVESTRKLAESNASTSGGKGGISSSDLTCVLKEAARQLIQELNNQPKVKAMNGILQALQTTHSLQVKDNNLFRKQKHTTPWRTKDTTKCRAFIRYDDDCGNGHHSFAITGETREFYDGRWVDGSAGCIHETVAEFFPELAPFIKWHLTSSDGPMHYISNTKYHASNKDCWGKLKGEPHHFHTHIKFGTFPVTQAISDKLYKFLKERTSYTDPELVIVEITHTSDGKTYSPQYTFEGLEATWGSAPFKSRNEAEQMKEALEIYPVEFVRVPWSWGEGKERDFDAARNSAVWPEATEAELMADDLEEKLKARHPQLMADFKADIEKLGLLFEPAKEPANEQGNS